MKKTVMSFLFTLFTLTTYSYENSMIDLKTPNGLEDGMLEFNIIHRARGPLNRNGEKTFLGMDNGVNYSIGLRYIPKTNFELTVAHTGDEKEYFASAGYSYEVEDVLKLKAGVDFFAFEKAIWTEKRANFFYYSSIQSYTIFERLIATANLGYDGYYKSLGCGLGFGMKVADGIKILGEYYPLLDKNRNSELGLGTEVAYSAGVKLETPGHHIFVTVGNSTDIGTRKLMLGTKNKDLYIGMNLTRIW